jgi:hypothetical protein
MWTLSQTLIITFGLVALMASSSSADCPAANACIKATNDRVYTMRIAIGDEYVNCHNNCCFLCNGCRDGCKDRAFQKYQNLLAAVGPTYDDCKV